LYVHQSKYPEAKDLCTRALKTLEHTFDRNHPSVADVLETLADLNKRVGNVAKAIELEQRVEKIRSRTQIVYEPIAKTIK
jgi:hypothetical protein